MKQSSIKAWKSSVVSRCLSRGLVSLVAVFMSIVLGSSAHASSGMDTMANAKLVSLTGSASQKLISNSDEDWYKVQITETGCFSLTFGPASGSKASDIESGWHYEFMDKNRNTLFSESYVKETVTSHKKALVPGTYYIRIYSPYTLSKANYILKPKFVKNENWITDQYGNDTEKSISFGKTYYGNMLNNGDVDLFKFEIKKNGYFTVSFGPTSDSNAADIESGWDYDILDSHGNVLDRNWYIKTAITTQKYSMSPGVYYARVSSPFTVSAADYNLRADFVEDNGWITDSYDEGSYKNIEFGKMYYGKMLNNNDDDYFRIVVPAKGYVSFTFKPDSSCNSKEIDSGWHYKLLDSKGNVLESDQYIKTAIRTERRLLQKGTYTFYVYSPFTCSRATYNISASYTPVSEKLSNPLTVKGRSVRVKRSVLKKKAFIVKRTSAFKINKAAGMLSYKKVSGNKRITINNKTGNITVKKGLKKGKYSVTVKVTAVGNNKYKKGVRTTRVIIMVK